MIMKEIAIKSRIFKKERVHEKSNDLVMIATNDETNKNQLELSWQNTILEAPHLLIVGRVMMKEWARLLGEYPVTRGFIQERSENQVRFYISFTVPRDLEKKEIRTIVAQSTQALEACLEKVIKKVQPDVLLEAESTPITDLSLSQDEEQTNQMIEKINREMAIQEELLKKLATQQETNQRLINQELPNEEVVVVENTAKAPSMEGIQLLKEQLTALEEELQLLSEENDANKKINIELDKANLKLSEVVEKNKVDVKKLEQLASLEKEVKQLKQENSDYRIQLSEQSSQLEQQKNTLTHLDSALEMAEQEKAELVAKYQEDFDSVNDELKESEKKALLEVNKRQKLEIELEETQKKLVKATLKKEEKDKKIKQLSLEIAQQLKKREKSLEDIATLETDMSQLETELSLARVTNEVLKEELAKYEVEKEKWQQLPQWEITYSELEESFNELSVEASNYRREIQLLTQQLASLKEKVTMAESYTPKETQVSYLVEEQKQEPVEQVMVDDTDDEKGYFSYEPDPYVEEVITEELMHIRKKDQVREEVVIKDLLEYYHEDSFKDIKVDRDEYRKHLLSFKFLSFRWSQVFIIKESDKNAAFLEWCAPFIEQIESFEQELALDVKKSFFNKNYVTMDESTYNILKGYSRLSTYLDTYYLKVSYYIDKYFLNEGNR